MSSVTNSDASGSKNPLHRVLVVEDDDALREAIASLLDDAGYENEQAPNGREALELLRRNDEPCLVLLDLMMPVMNGWELYEEMQQDERLATYPVLFLSAFPSSFAPTRNFLGKPLDLKRLLAAIEQHCH